MPRLNIESLSHDGKGLARIGGKVAFVAGALAGEVVSAELAQRHRRFDEYRLLEVLEASADRVNPPCPLIGRCGGCDLQHLAEGAQLAHKTRVLLDQLARQSGLSPEAMLPPLTSEPFAYRRRARLAVSVPRRGGRASIGLRVAGGKDVVPIDRCPVLVPAVESLPGRLQALLNGLERPAALGHVELSVSETDDGAAIPVIYLRMVTEPTVRDRSAMSDFAIGERAYLAFRIGEGALDYLHRPQPQDPGYRLPAFDLRLGYLPGAFMQGNGAINRALVDQVVTWTVSMDGSRVLDGFCGVGNFALPMARRGLAVHGVEVSPDAVAMARDNAARNGLADVSFEVRDLAGDADWLRHLSFDAAVIDPPRTGARALIAALAARRLENIVYVSCAPATLARDAAVLAGAGYELVSLRLVDMFPQTSHIESVSLFRLSRRGRRRSGQRGNAAGGQTSAGA
ncbi:MAG: methyltransferase domain-containing protein [Pseudomonadales bacterium]